MGADEDAVAFCQAVRPQLMGALVLYCGDRHVAEELAQDTLERVWRRWSVVGAKANPAGYTHRMAINAANSWYRRRGAERRAAERHGADERAGEVDPDNRMVLRRAVMALPRRQRTALVLRYYADLPVDEVAALMGCATGTVKSLTSHAIVALRRSDLLDWEPTDA